MHRPGNVDDPSQARRIVGMLREVAKLAPLVIPLHPRGKSQLEAAGLRPMRDCGSSTPWVTWSSSPSCAEQRS